jgi:pyridinium-3,5-biscarboxylic acid mononucleotide sulfurtransferase
MLASRPCKEQQLVGWLQERQGVLVGYSGGVDSAYLACVAVEAVGRDNVLAVIGRSPSYPAEQWAVARSVAERVGLTVQEVETDEIEDPRYAANPVNRCYFCKGHLWSRLVPLARERGIGTVVDGTNADDLLDDRPGGVAGREYGVESPLAIVGLTKGEIRALSRARGLPTWDQPSAPCLSSRIPHGTPVTPGRLRQVEDAEAALRAVGVAGDLRVRHHGELARVEIGGEQLTRWLAADRRAAVAAAVLGAGYRRAAIDLAGFQSGSLNARPATSGAPAHAIVEGLDVEHLSDSGVALVREPDRLAQDSDLRARLVVAARAVGYRHVAVELPS